MLTLTKKYADKILEMMKPISKKADYWDVRLAESESTLISYRSRDLESLSFPKFSGGSVRVFNKGGWGLATFMDLKDFKKAANQALVFTKFFNKRKIVFKPTEAIKKVILSSSQRKDFSKIEPKEKIRLLNHYRDCLWQKKTALVKSTLSYFDNLSRKLFLSSDGSVIEQEISKLRCVVYLVAKKGGIIQEYSDDLAFMNFGDLKNKESKIKEGVELVNSLVDSSPAKSGEYPVVIDNRLAGTFAHEAFGHLSEADILIEDPRLREIMVMGTRFGSNKITIFDDPNMGTWGSYSFDDEGVRPKKAVLLEKGILKGRLHSRETAAVLGEEPNGHARAEGVLEMPLVRMGTTVVAPGKAAWKDLVNEIRHGYYCVGFRAGMTDYADFTFTAMYGYEIVKGKLKQMVRDIKLSGNLFKTLKLVDLVGKDSKEDVGFCGKMGQKIAAGTIAPSLRLSKVLVLGA